MRVGVVGIGKLGSCLAAVLAQRFTTVAVDLDQALVDRFNDGDIPFNEPLLDLYLKEAKPIFTTDFNLLEDTDISFVIVPTPSDSDGIFTSEYVIDAVTRIGKVLRHKIASHTVCIVSTVMPGQTDGPIRQALEDAAGKPVPYCYSPEFIALGDVINGLENPDMVLLGESCQEAGDAYLRVSEWVVPGATPLARMTVLNAELTKIGVNAYITMKATFANNLGEICERLPGADANVVSKAIGMDSRINKRYFQPAVAVSGPCLPRDSLAFSMVAKQVGVDADLAEATDVINKRQTTRLVDRVLGLVQPKGVVGVLGLSYKPGTPVMDASPGFALVEALKAEGVEVLAFDPMASMDGMSRSAEDVVRQVSVVVVMTPWPEFREIVFPLGCTVLDCWNFIESKKVFGELLRSGVGL